MQSRCVKLTVPEKLYQDSLGLVKELGYSNVQELTVEGLRKQVIELRKQQALINLKKNFGSAAPIPRMTKEQKEKIARKHTPTRAREIIKNYGVGNIRV